MCEVEGFTLIDRRSQMPAPLASRGSSNSKLEGSLPRQQLRHPDKKKPAERWLMPFLSRLI
ncbi:hypothetical protein PORCAN_1730 [Porphyromonas crevioricanis JCM 13913]|nr:hypothetical protein PORCAN_1730 [Porphyromonas crevioricanis JCM 13913]